MRQHKFLQFGELSELFEVGVVDYQVEPNVCQVKLLNHLVELLALQDFQSISVDIKHFI